MESWCGDSVKGGQKMSEKPNGRSLGEEERDQLTGVLKKSTVEAKITFRMWEKLGGTLFSL